jgi:hypothetical protein
VPTGGTTGQVLTKTSATDFDTAWQAASGGGAAAAVPVLRGLTTGQWVGPLLGTIDSGGASLITDRLYAVPLPWVSGKAVTRVAAKMNGVGLYTDVNGKPGALLWDSGDGAVGEFNTQVRDVSPDVTINDTCFWCAVRFNSGLNNPEGWAYQSRNSSALAFNDSGSNTPNESGRGGYFMSSAGFSALPTTFTPGAPLGALPVPFVLCQVA